MIAEGDILNRVELLVGPEVMARLASARVLLFGVGGVGSWCAEALVRTGIGHLTIVDSDRVAVSNINRQLMATTVTVGRVKVDALRDHLLLIRPDADITAVQQIFCEQTAHLFDLDAYDFVVDCIDSLKDKALLIRRATRSKARLLSSMGAALKMDPTRIRVAEFRKVEGCPLARALRQRFKRSGNFPARKFLCVYSDEVLRNAGSVALPDREEGAEADAMRSRKAQINGSLMHITAIFGLTLAGLIVQAVSDNK